MFGNNLEQPPRHLPAIFRRFRFTPDVSWHRQSQLPSHLVLDYFLLYGFVLNWWSLFVCGVLMQEMFSQPSPKHQPAIQNDTRNNWIYLGPATQPSPSHLLAIYNYNRNHWNLLVPTTQSSPSHLAAIWKYTRKLWKSPGAFPSHLPAISTRVKFTFDSLK